MKFLHQKEGVVIKSNRLVNLILLDILWLICSIPIFTSGAATCAVYDIMMQYAQKKEPKMIPTFFQSFKRNFIKGTALFFIFLTVGIFLIVSLYHMILWNMTVKYGIIIVLLSMGYFYVAIVIHSFAVMVYFELGVKETIKEAFSFSTSNNIYTISILVTNALVLFLLFFFQKFWIWIVLATLIFKIDVVAYFGSRRLLRVFNPKRVRVIERVDIGEIYLEKSQNEEESEE